jgi:hypothetical protein
VSDVDAAFPQLPFAPWLWPFMFHRFYEVGGDALRLFCHINCDFGTRGLPGTFKIFFVDVLLQMARSKTPQRHLQVRLLHKLEGQVSPLLQEVREERRR